MLINSFCCFTAALLGGPWTPNEYHMAVSTLLVTTASAETLNSKIVGVTCVASPPGPIVVKSEGAKSSYTQIVPFGRTIHYDISLHNKGETPICLFTTAY